MLNYSVAELRFKKINTCGQVIKKFKVSKTLMTLNDTDP